MTRERRRRHLGLDLGGTNIKWAVLEHDGGSWRTLDRDQVADAGRADADAVPDAVVGQLAEVGARGDRPRRGRHVGRHRRARPVRPGRRHDAFLVNVPGPWAGHPVAGPVGDAVGAAGVPHQRRAGVRPGRAAAGAGRGAASMVGLTLGTGVGGVIAIDGRVLPGPRRDRRRDRATRRSTPTGRGAAAATAAASRRSPGPTRSPPPAGRRPPRRPSTAARAGDARAREGLAESAATSASGSPT